MSATVATARSAAQALTPASSDHALRPAHSGVRAAACC